MAGARTILIGLDAAAQLDRFGYAIGAYDGPEQPIAIHKAGLLGGAPVDESAIDTVLVPAIRAVERVLIAIDAPLGWPAALSMSLNAHRAGDSMQPLKDDLFMRETDRFVHRTLGKRPLEIGADRIARAAHTALWVLNRLRTQCGDIPLVWVPTWSGRGAIEVYPGGTLQACLRVNPAYKRREQTAARERIAQTLSQEVAGMSEFVCGAVDVFDACVCLAAARDFMENRALSPADANVPSDLVEREGWIWVRKGI